MIDRSSVRPMTIAWMIGSMIRRITPVAALIARRLIWCWRTLMR